jgi:hypothetical protein
MKWINIQIEWVKSFLSEPINGSGVIDKGSSKRLAAVGVTFTFMFTYIKTALETKTIPEIPEAWIWLIGAVLGITGVVDFLKARNEKKPQ